MTEGTDARKQEELDPADTVSSPFATLHVHMIGIAGCGMRALAEMLARRGAIVSGSDMASSAATRRLMEFGMGISIGQCGDNIPADCELVVHSAAIHEGNPELIAAAERGIEVVKYSKMLGRMMGESTGIAIAGTHGKSTTTGMVAYVLRAAGFDPNFVVGATVDQLGGPSGVGKGTHFVAEACEFDRSFLNLEAKYAAILNVEYDHPDSYRDIDEIVEAFKQFVAKVPPDGIVVVNGDDRNSMKTVADAACEVETFGLADGCMWRGTDVQHEDGMVTMGVTMNEQEFCHLKVPLIGLHNAYNSLAAIAILHHAGVDAEEIVRRLEEYTGARRRMMLKTTDRGVTVIDDYAHHPTEIQVTLKAIRDYYKPRRLICVFQPHQHSRTRFQLKDFASSFGKADDVIVPDIYFVRDSEREKDYICSDDLVSQIRLHGGEAIYLKSFEEIVTHLKDIVQTGDLVVTMGAGNVWEVADEIVHWLREDS
ncbi:MAG: UDP-N-acetylmuramate--L-alanine ligase [Phycisphaerae bacterium]|jgi:UDP-N-acetylmuramate--alanine ligase|nr:UDP-N-acetylmuramate--L-alanine ligase [Phycisphaerae bacterium]